MEEDSDNLQFIVDRLNAEVFEKELTLISLSEFFKSPRQCLELLNSVVKVISEEHALNLSTTSIEEALDVYLELLMRLKYKPQTSAEVFYKNLQNGDSSTYLHLLHFLLANFESCKMRVYVSRFLMPPEVPPEHTMDATIQRQLEELHGHQERFKEAHRAYMAAKDSRPDSDALGDAIQRLTIQRDQLQGQIETLAAKIAPHKDSAACVELAGKARRNLQESDGLKAKIEGQRDIAVSATSHASALEETLGHHSATTLESALELLEALRGENHALTTDVETTLPEAIEAKQQILAICKDTGDPTERLNGELEAARALRAKLTGELQLLEAASAAPGHDVEGLRALLTALGSKYAKLELHRAKLQKQIGVEEQKLDQLLGSRNESIGEALTSGKMSNVSLRRSLKRYRTLQEELRPMRQRMTATQRELTVARHTIQVLATLAEYDGPLDGALGDDEPLDFDDFDEDVASEPRVRTGQSMDERMSAEEVAQAQRVFDEMEAELETRRKKLEPRLQELTELRTAVAELEADVQTRTEAIEQLTAGEAGAEFRLRREAATLEGGIEELRTELHRLECIALIFRAEVSFGTQNERKRSILVQEIRRVIAERSKETRALRKRLEQLSREHDARRAQKVAFANLSELLAKKLELTAARKQGAGASPSLQSQHGLDGTDILQIPNWQGS
eukprot:gnl/Chilomastix_cuspidata/99.p1 GENE.gnl/Chilomastix_cuspidata/99~~gnl/Chilomastix_cuspidata/99.p1  ORF type:complete len:681 (-),score=422.60 gnl/Chilomastix_cuspidata/99:377-2419(-)